MRPLITATVLAAACSVCTTVAFAQQQPASTDGKSVPMQEAPAKIKPGKSAAKRLPAKSHGKMH